jgi:hypothetical protein
VLFEGASRDGDKVFFRTTAPLTADDRNGEGQAPPPGGVTSGAASSLSWDLYMYDMPDSPGADPADGDLTRISAGPLSDGDCNSPQNGADQQVGALRYLSDDGSRLFFACAAPLGGVPAADDGTTTAPGGTPSISTASNVYAYDLSLPQEQRWRFIARLPRSSTLGACATTGIRPGHPIGSNNDQDKNLNIFDPNCWRGSRDAGHVSFFTDGQLTDDDPDAVSGDIYGYDFESDELVRITAPQGGVGGAYPCTQAGGPPCYGDDGIGGSTGGFTLPKLGVVEDPDGHRLVFFESRSRLIASDTDDAYDVYRWRDGQLGLVSTGTDMDVFYAGSDRTGLNVYLATRDRLTWEDHDSVFDVYTARTGGGFDPPADTSEHCDTVAGGCQDGGAIPGQPQIDSDQPGQGNPPTANRIRLTLNPPSAKARRKAARTGTLALRLTTSSPTRATVTARAKIARRTRRIASAQTRIATTKTVRLKLTRQARRQLAKHHRLTITITATTPNTRPTTTTTTLKRK